jgi:hypothetical protein
MKGDVPEVKSRLYCKAKTKLGLRVGYKVLLILPAMELSGSAQNGMESYRRPLSQQGNVIELSGKGWNMVEESGMYC